jgi:hypothetical protein
MMDRLLSTLLRGLILTLITTCIVVAMTFLYSAMFSMIQGKTQTSAVSLGLALACGLGISALWRHRGDLMYG